MSTQQLIFAVIYFAIGAGLIFLAVLIIRDSFRVRLNRVTSAMLFLAGLGPIFTALGEVISPYQAATPFRTSYLYNLFYVWELFFPVLLYFSWVFPHDRLAGRRSRWRWLIFVPHIFHVILLAFFSDTDRILNWLTIEPGKGGLLNTILEPIASLLTWLMIPIGLILSSHKNFFALINLLYVGGAIYSLFRGTKRIEAPSLRKQVQIIILGIHISMGLYVFTFLLPNLIALQLSDMVKAILTATALVIGAGSIAWAIIRYQFLDVRLIIRQSLVYTASSAILVGLYILAVSEFSDVLTSFFGQQMPIINIGFVVVALIFFQPINNQIDNVIKKMFIRDRADHRNIINRLSLQIISILDRGHLFRVVEEALRTSMLVTGVGFSIYDDALQAYLYFPGSESEGQRLTNTDPMLGAIGQLKAPTFYDRIELWRRGSALATILKTSDVQLIVPLSDREHLLGFMTLKSKTSGFKFSYEDITLLSTLANQMVVALANVRLYRESLIKQKLEEEMNLARQIQIDLLPQKPPSGRAFRVSAHSRPSRTVGGDFYDFVQTDENGGFALIIADVSGKGMPAAMLAAQLQAALRAEVGNRRAVSQTVTNVNRIVSNLSSSSGKYATLFYGEFHPQTMDFEFSNAGHNYPILVRADGACEFLVTGGTIVGAFESSLFEAHKVRLAADDLIFFYTDGLSEAARPGSDEFGEKRIVDYLVQNRHRTPEEIQDGILHQVRTFSGADSPEDDTTVVILKVTV